MNQEEKDQLRDELTHALDEMKPFYEREAFEEALAGVDDAVNDVSNSYETLEEYKYDMIQGAMVTLQAVRRGGSVEFLLHTAYGGPTWYYTCIVDRGTEEVTILPEHSTAHGQTYTNTYRNVWSAEDMLILRELGSMYSNIALNDLLEDLGAHE